MSDDNVNIEAADRHSRLLYLSAMEKGGSERRRRTWGLL